MNPATSNPFPQTLARKRPALTYLLITFAWTWAFWLAAIPFHDRGDLLVTALVIIGGYGPAIGGILTLSLQEGQTSQRSPRSPRRLPLLMAGAAFIFLIMATRYLVGNVPGFDTLAPDLSLSLPVLAALILACLTGGWVIASAVAGRAAVRARMASILPVRLPLGWTLFGLLFFPAMVVASWGLGILLGLGVEYPGLWGQPALRTLPIYLLAFILTALAQGGNEEPGWRGFLQPQLQRRHSPLVAALIVAGFWSLWHLPLYLNGFYPGDLLGGMLGGAIYRVLLAIFLAWFYQRSGGNLFLMIYLHTCFNLVVNFLPTSDLGLLLLWLAVVIGVVLKDRMYRKPPVVMEV